MTAMIGGADRASARLAATRAGWHRVAEHMPAAALHRAAGHTGLVRSPGGFRSPSFGTDARFRAVDGTELVISGAAGTKRTPVTTVRAAAEFAPGLSGDGRESFAYLSVSVCHRTAVVGRIELATLRLQPLVACRLARVAH